MADRIAVSFEDNIIKIVYASFGRGNLVIEKTLAIKDEEFGSFLKGEKKDEFTVVTDFTAPYQEILSLPDAKERYLKLLIEESIRKNSPELGKFSFIYAPVGEKILEGKKTGEYFVFAVSHDSLFRIMDRFTMHGKRVRYLLPSVFALPRIVRMPAGLADAPVLCVAETGEKKILFLIRNKKLCFFRTAQSFGSGILDFDVQNINMTINYCNQTLKVPPAHLLLIGTAGSRFEASAKLALPAECIAYPSDIIGQREILDEFLAPVSALIRDKDSGRGDLLPAHYRNFYTQKSVLTYGTAAFLVLSLAGLGYALKNYSYVRSAGEAVSSLRADIGGMMSVPEYFEGRSAELGKIMPSINFVNAVNSMPDFQSGLIAASRLRMKDVNLSSVALKAEGGVLALSIKGEISAASYDETQERYRGFIEAIKKIQGLVLSSERIDMNSRGFQAEARYKNR